METSSGMNKGCPDSGPPFEEDKIHKGLNESFNFLMAGIAWKATL